MEARQLKLVHPELDDTTPDVLPFERRQSERKALHGSVTVLRTDLPSVSRENRLWAVQLRDLSETGIGFVAEQPIGMGATISVLFPPHGPERGFDMFGRVVRCQQRREGEGYDIGVELFGRAAA